ncbi:MAG: murein biosynthesis integral membrane protein MurJ [Polaromonas sp.]|uniref:murein biosynthesis integral membrane protein MurJ n=1 Tax=Polaromonas sp. TaxID=1869339 RepID=UPI001802DED4|nr:murein biosynthesis integral membrane protein MurJ [Polaromonas sp.]MBA3592272.1 murein biosynthesis integral membrane protein MurJ [Polaromonas sp.]
MSLFKSASTVSLFTLVSRITGLVRDFSMTYIFGVSAMTDAFWVAFRIPNMLRRMFGEGAFSQAFVPVLATSKEKDGVEATKLLIDKVATVLAWVLVLTSVLGVAAAPWFVYAMASGLQQNPRGFEAAVWMTRFMFPYIACMSLVVLSAGILNTWKKFVIPAATPVLLNVAMISAAWLGAPWFKAHGIEPIYAMALGVMLGGLLQVGIQIPALYKMGLLPRFSFRWAEVKAAWRDPATKNVINLMLPALLGVSVAQISLLINTQIASHLATGSVSWLNSASLLMEFPTAMLGVALGVVLMPQLAAARAVADHQKYSDMIDWGLRLVLMLALPSAVALLTFAKPLVASLYHYGAFKDTDVTQVALALMGYGAGLLGLVAIKVLASAYFARQDTKTPVKIALVVLVFTQLLNVLLVPYLQHAALALSIGLGALLNAGWLLAGLLKNKAYTPQPGWGRFALQTIAASALMAAFLIWASTAVDWVGLRSHVFQRAGFLILAIGVAAAIYFVALWVSGLKLRQLLRK